MNIPYKTSSITFVLAASLTITGCQANGENLKLIGINESNCIICIQQVDMKQKRSTAVPTRQTSPSQADVSPNALTVTPVPGTDKEIPRYAIDDQGTTKPVSSRYGDLYVIEANDEYYDERQVLIFNGQPIYDPMNPPGYEGDDEDSIGSYLAFGTPIQLGDYDIIPVSSSSGGSGQKAFAHGIVFIGPDKRAKAFGHDGMLSRSSKMRVENGHVIAEYDRLTIVTDGQTNTVRPKRMDNVPDDICTNLYKNRKDLANAWKKGKDFSAAGNPTDDWGDAALEYKAFKPEALVKASGKISYAKFKKQVCGG